MGQVTIYLEDEIENRMNAAAKSSHLSKSKWVAKLIHEKVANEWPQLVADFAGSWDDFPSIEDIRKNSSVDIKREKF
ncbi:hypothetical protein MNBD_GAMMA06-1630 [hydrothermal vent metagenome]|uniref:CopG family transcriptional regulator n=1 Tax=hydrothermal vent metagenome TaxID=652676 RepID=A0A3B0W3G5_9ZZZZ